MGKEHVLGITAKRSKGRTFGEQTTYLRGLIRLARARRMRAYVFTPRDVDEEAQRVRAWVWSKGHWHRRWQPLPTVIHDRMWGLRDHEKHRYDEELAHLRDELGIPVFNPDFGSKFDVHRLLVNHDDLRAHLPETHLASPEALRRLCDLHGTVYIKPIRGRQGKGICRLQRTKGGFRVTRRTGTSGSTSLFVPTVDKALSTCIKRGQTEEFIAQQGLDLLRVQGGTVDVRVIVQRDGKGTWHASAIGCRIGRRGGFVSNLHAGGRAASLSSLRRHLPRSARIRTLRRTIQELSVTTARTMEEVFPTLGEIGLDLGVDRSGSLWILEVNRQPGRSLFARAGLRKSWSRSRLRVVQFAKYLSALEAHKE